MRCAIYTRKSTEEGLAQEFNSLDAQRESAESFILSQRHAGWSLVPEAYDDGGYSGTNLERPALRRLLVDMEAGHIDCIVVYKIDRLSRSLMDFTGLIGRFEKLGINLVSVTQQFNTTNSLGRLTLNILLSFAQFESELTGDRVREKMMAAVCRGRWVGGIPVLGYEVGAVAGKLRVNPEEAHTVRAIFALYLEHGSLAPVLRHAQQQQWTTKRWTTKKGILRPGRPLVERDLMAILTNVTYTGKIHHRGQNYPGEHAALVEEVVWERVQILLEENRRGLDQTLTPSRRRSAYPILQEEGPSCPSIRVPRITRLLSLAVKFERLIRQGIIRTMPS
jgi:site-specific DNA recombinase